MLLAKRLGPTYKPKHEERHEYTLRTVHSIYGLETVVSVLFSNTRTRLLYNGFSILHKVKLSAFENFEFSTVSKCVYLKTKHELTVSNPFNTQFEFTAGNRLTMASRLNTAVFMRYCNNALCHFDVAR